jgi:2'-5' RNA ligase
LKFLGDINTLAIEKTLIVLQKLSSQYHSFQIVLSKKIGVFPNFKKPRVIWIGIEEGYNEVKKIYYDIERELKNKPFYRYDNKFSPHITLGRVKYIKYPANLAEFLRNHEHKDISQLIQSIELMESKLTSNGPIYTVISKFPFLK